MKLTKTLKSLARVLGADAPKPLLNLDTLNDYDVIIVAFSGGKDSVACVLHLLEMGIDPSRIELWHHDVDGREGSDLMDWPVTRDYCRKFADAFGMKIYFSWKVGGFEGEMLRKESLTQPVRFECPDGTTGQAGGVRGKKATRLMFPQVAADLSTRWCSAYLKIDVCTAAINNQERFRGIKTLVVTGERAQESAGRAKYKVFEPHKADLRNGKRYQRHVDSFRAVHTWSEEQVWAIMQRFGVNPHPCYKLGFGRCSCMPCIFGGANQFASVKKLDPKRFEKLANYEEQFGKTIKRKVSLRVLAGEGKAYKMSKKDMREAMDKEFNAPILVNPSDWTVPSGAFSEETCGAA